MTSKTPSTSSSSVSYTSEAATSSNRQMDEFQSEHDRIAGDNENTQLPTSKNNAKFSRLCHNSRDKTKLQKQLFDHQHENLEDHEEALCYEKQNSTNKQHKRKKLTNCVIFIGMLLMAILATALVAYILSENPLKPQSDKCGDSIIVNPRYKEFKLFGTKTSYSDALERAEIEKLKIFQYADRFDKPSHSVKDRAQPHSPVARFMKNVDLEMKRDNCHLSQFHFYGRHAARYPSDDEIIQINDLMDMVKSRIDLTKFSQPQFQPSTNANKTDIGPSSFQANNLPKSLNNNTPEHDSDNRPMNTTVCANPAAEFVEWSSNLYPAQNDLILESGYREARLIAERLKSLYPDMFDGQKSEITLAVTEKIRTVQTALPFLRLFENYKPDGCSPDRFPTDANGENNASLINGHQCYQQFIKNYEQKDLRFYKECGNKGSWYDSAELHINKPPRTENIASTVSKLLKLDNNQSRLNSSHIEAIYKVCKFETAMSGKSIWCGLFSEDDLKFLDYKEDIDDYFNQALYGRDLYESPCKLTLDIVRKMRAESDAPNHETKPKAFYHFAHAETIQRFLAHIAQAQLADEEIEPSKANDYLNHPENPHYLQWRSGLLSPFSANIAFSLYQCHGPSPTFKVVAALNERPIRIDRCSDVICPLDQFFNSSEGVNWARCNYNEICKVHTKFL